MSIPPRFQTIPRIMIAIKINLAQFIRFSNPIELASVSGEMIKKATKKR